MPCCHLPPPIPPSLVPDAERFSKYVGGAPLGAIGVPHASTLLTSGLNLEMKLWKPTNYTYQPNQHELNSWRVMSRRTTAPNRLFLRHTQKEKDLIFSKIIKIKPEFNKCNLIPFDDCLLKLIIQLRHDALARLGIGLWEPVVPPQRPPEVGTIGLAQKLINIYFKYEICWQFAGQWDAGAFTVYTPKILFLQNHLCALHAPIDSILLKEINKLPLGKYLRNKRILINGDNLRQANGVNKPWSKLDCLRTYYGLQLILRRVAMNTWPKGCACSARDSETLADSASRLIKECADWYNSEYYANDNAITDWIKIATEIPQDTIDKTLEKITSKEIPHSPNLPKLVKDTKRTTSNRLKNNDSVFCLQCSLGETILKKHRLSGLNLPIINDNATVQHNVGHRIVCSTKDRWTYQYHVNQNSVRIDRFASDKDIYNQFCENHGVLNFDFGNGIKGNGTRSICKLTLEGANAGAENFDRIAEEAVQIMSEIYCL
jgi:hypothetical protein